MPSEMDLRQSRSKILRRAKQILDTAEEEHRDVTREETRDFNSLLCQADALALRIGNLPLSHELELSELIAYGKKSKGRTVPPSEIIGEQIPREEERNFSFARAIRAISTGDWSGADVERRAMGTTSDVSGGWLVSSTPALELISMLKPKLIFNRIPGVSLYYPAGGDVPFPKKVSRSNAYWISEGADIKESAPTFGEVWLRSRKLATILTANNELLSDTSGLAEQVIRDDLVESLSLACDLAYLRGPGASNEPLGIRNWGGVQTVDAKNFTTDVMGKALVNVLAADGDPTCWIAHPRVKGKLIQLKDGEGRPLLAVDLTAAPQDRLLGLPILYSTQVPTNLGAGGDETEMYCVDGNQIVIGIWKKFELSASNSAALWDSGASRAVSAFQRDQTLIRAIMRTDILVRNPEAICVMTGIKDLV